MKRKKGFMATSIIYSFFLVFLMLMVTIVARGVSNRIFVSLLKKDIRSSLQAEEGFIVDELTGNYTVGEVVSFAGENWRVLEIKTNSIVLILKDGLTKNTIINNITDEKAKIDANKNIYFGTCSDVSCQVRACRAVPSFSDASIPQGVYDPVNCYYDTAHAQYLIPTWDPIKGSDAPIDQTDQNYSQTIVADVLLNWFRTHIGLQRMVEKNQLVAQTFQDGVLNYPQKVGAYTQKDYFLRLPLSTEVSKIVAADTVLPFHLLRDSSATGTQTNICNTSRASQRVASSTAAYIRPVIEVKKN